MFVKIFLVALCMELSLGQFINVPKGFSGLPVNLNKRIINGEQAPDRLPWLVSIRDSKQKHFCGGSYIAPNLILAAAHCFKNMDANTYRKFTISGGRYDLAKSTEEEGGVDFDIVHVNTHPQYVQQTYKNDIAVIEVRPRAGFEQNLNRMKFITLDDTDAGKNGIPLKGMQGTSYSPTRQPSLAVRNANIQSGSSTEQKYQKALDRNEVETENAVNANIFATGWGARSESDKTPFPILVRAPMFMTRMSRCEKHLNDLDRNSVLCVVGADFASDTCAGDSGGPLFTDDGKSQTLVGIVSFGIGCARQEVLSNGEKRAVAAVYQKVSYFRPHVEQIAQQLGKSLVPCQKINDPSSVW
ncbi:hypothetical protein MP638_004216 [Amoeboaphelidium occidentale]|nr:hypothetical protein MP638_004216 [Amoeboaphelidium occidentale]